MNDEPNPCGLPDVGGIQTDVPDNCVCCADDPHSSGFTLSISGVGPVEKVVIDDTVYVREGDKLVEQGRVLFLAITTAVAMYTKASGFIEPRVIELPASGLHALRAYHSSLGTTEPFATLLGMTIRIDDRDVSLSPSPDEVNRRRKETEARLDNMLDLGLAGDNPPRREDEIDSGWHNGGWEHEKQFQDHRQGLKVTVGMDTDGDIGILCQDGRREGQTYSIIVDSKEAPFLARHLLSVWGDHPASQAGDTGKIKRETPGAALGRMTNAINDALGRVGDERYHHKHTTDSLVADIKFLKRKLSDRDREIGEVLSQGLPDFIQKYISDDPLQGAAIVNDMLRYALNPDERPDHAKNFEEMEEKLDESVRKLLAGKVFQSLAGHRPKNMLGYCPKCGAPGITRERRPDGNDTCNRGHVYRSTTALEELPADKED